MKGLMKYLSVGLSVLVMAELAGPVGLIVAVPLLATVTVLVGHILIGHVYADGAVLPAGIDPSPVLAAAAPPDRR